MARLVLAKVRTLLAVASTCVVGAAPAAVDPWRRHRRGVVVPGRALLHENSVFEWMQTGARLKGEKVRILSD